MPSVRGLGTGVVCPTGSLGLVAGVPLEALVDAIEDDDTGRSNTKSGVCLFLSLWSQKLRLLLKPLGGDGCWASSDVTGSAVTRFSHIDLFLENDSGLGVLESKRAVFSREPQLLCLSTMGSSLGGVGCVLSSNGTGSRLMRRGRAPPLTERRSFRSWEGFGVEMELEDVVSEDNEDDTLVRFSTSCVKASTWAIVVLSCFCSSWFESVDEARLSWEALSAINSSLPSSWKVKQWNFNVS